MGKLHVEILDNQRADNPELDRFITTAANGTLFHRPRFLAYHTAAKLNANQVRYRHLVFRRRTKIVGFLPGALVDHEAACVYCSPWGASMGGLVVHPEAAYAEVEEMVAVWLQAATDWGAQRIEVTLVPICFQNVPAQDTVEFAMVRQGFSYAACTLMMTVKLPAADGFPDDILDDNARRRVKQATNRGCEVLVSNDLDAFWSMNVETMQSHGSTPTHTKEEMAWLWREQPDAFCLHLAYAENCAVGGMLLFQVTDKAATTFYIASRRDAQGLRPVNLLSYRVLQWARQKGLDWLDFGPSTFGLEPHNTLIHFKEEHGGRGILRRKMQRTLRGEQNQWRGTR